MFGLGSPEISLILSTLILFFGATKLPNLARGLGNGIREFKDATKDVNDTINQSSLKHSVERRPAFIYQT